MPEETKTQLSRRAVLGLTTAAVAGTLVACNHSHPAISTAPLRRRFLGKSVLITGGPLVLDGRPPSSSLPKEARWRSAGGG